MNKKYLRREDIKSGMLQELPAYPEDSNKSLKGGQRVRISKFENGKYYFN